MTENDLTLLPRKDVDDNWSRSISHCCRYPDQDMAKIPSTLIAWSDMATATKTKYCVDAGTGNRPTPCKLQSPVVTGITALLCAAESQTHASSFPAQMRKRRFHGSISITLRDTGNGIALVYKKGERDSSQHSPERADPKSRFAESFPKELPSCHKKK